jgi:hypothetical protein
MKLSLIAMVVMVVCGQALGGSEKKSSASVVQQWNRGLSAARSGNADTALVCLKRAFAGGLSDDSLYYLWAEVFLYRGVLDTALALNYSVVTPSGTALHRQLLKQRHTIFSSLGWKKEADALLDSLGGKHVSLLRKLLPECNLYLSGGAYRENNAVDKNYPYPRSSDSVANITNGSGIASLRVGWKVPVTATQGVQFGGRLRFAGSRFTLASSATRLDDSADAALGAYCNYTLFSERLSVNYTFSRKRDFLGAKSFWHQAALRYAILSTNWFGTVEAGYNYENPVREHYYYLMTWWDREITKKHDLSFSLFLSGLSAGDLRVDDDIPFVYVKEGTIYNDSAYARPLLVTIGLSQEALYDTLRSERVIPISFWGVNPNLRYEYRFNRKVTAGIAGNYQVSWYRGTYTWVDYRYQSAEVPRTGIRNPFQSESYIAFNADDQRYYWIESIRSTRDITLDTQPILFHRKRRIDQALTLDLFLKSSFGRLGDAVIDVVGRRNFSNLEKSAPIDIERWYGAVTLTWFFKFKPDETK